MASPVNDNYSVSSGATLYAGRYAPVAHVFIMAGQSNSSGRVPIAQAPANTNPVAGVSTWKRTTHTTGTGQWQNLSHSNNQYDLRNEFGSELQLMKNAATAFYTGGTNNVFLIKLADGGTSLAVDWADASALRTSLFTGHITDALTDLHTSWDTVKVYGFYWDQGEQDAINEAQSLAYQTNLTNFFSALRTNIGIPDLPIVARRMNTAATSLTYVANVISAQDAVATADPNTQLTDEAWSHIGDNLHLDATAQNNQGDVVFNLLNTIGGKIHNG